MEAKWKILERIDNNLDLGNAKKQKKNLVENLESPVE
jgi:hypothetical protein